MNLTTARKALETYLDKDIPTFLWGAPGVGKSDLIRQIAKDHGWNLIDFRAVLRDPVDLRGLPSIDDGQARWLPPSDLPNPERDGSEGILFLDELNAAAPSVQAACFGLVLDRKVGEYRLPSGWRIIAAGNRQSDRAAAQSMPTALANRFAHLEIDADPETFTAWANRQGLDPLLIAFIRFRPALLHSMAEKNAQAFPSPRSWAQAAKLIDVEPALRSVMVEGIVGAGAAAELEGFIRTAKDLPRVSDIFKSPETVKVPTDPAARFAVTAAVARSVDTDTIDAGLTYMRRLPDEFEVMFMVDASNRDEELTKTSAFISFSQEHFDVVTGQG